MAEVEIRETKENGAWEGHYMKVACVIDMGKNKITKPKGTKHKNDTPYGPSR